MCGKLYNARFSTQRTCKSVECTRKLYKEYNNNKKTKQDKKPVAVKKTKKCEICGKTFEPYRHTQKICGDKKCTLERDRNYNRKRGTKVKPEVPPKNRIREYTFTSNMMICDDIKKGMSLKEMAELYDRDIDDLKEHIKKIYSDGTVDKILRWKKSVDRL